MLTPHSLVCGFMQFYFFYAEGLSDGIRYTVVVLSEHYAEGGATVMPRARAELRRYTVIVLSVSQSFCPLRISRHSLKTKR